MDFIWILIVHYEIHFPHWEMKGDCKNVWPENKLLMWIKKMLPDKLITNFTTDWIDGKNIADLVLSLGD